MAKRGAKKKNPNNNQKNSYNNHKNGNNTHNHPRLREELTFGQKAADKIAEFGGSWYFILGFMVFLFVWMGLNMHFLKSYDETWDPYPFILLNLVLSCLAALQAPVILMSQNRQAQRDRIDAGYDHAVNRKAEREIQITQKEIKNLKRIIKELRKK